MFRSFEGTTLVWAGWMADLRMSQSTLEVGMTPQSADPTSAEDFVLRLPDEASKTADQDEEWFEVEQDGETRRLRFHDYSEIYSIPGLYERLIYEELRCESPKVIAGLMADEIARRGDDPASLRVLDLGAGNGIVAEHLQGIGADYFVGVDIIPEAEESAKRDRPGLYDDYVTANLLDYDEGTRKDLDDQGLNAMTCVAALGFGDIPPEVFCEALRRTTTPALVAYTIKEKFLGETDESGFSDLVERLDKDGSLVTLQTKRYQHRLSWAGEPLYYVAVLAEKRADL
jgi:SAM-dependent methyltransferase